MRFVGGPADGMDLETKAGIVLVEGSPGRYVKWWDPPVAPPEQDGWDETDYFLRGVHPPAKPERYMLWQEAGHYMDHPSIAALRLAFREAKP